MLCRNVGQAVARFQIDGTPGVIRRYAVEPGGEVDIPDGYCKPYKSQGGRRNMRPLITQLHSAMQPTGKHAPGTEPIPEASGNDVGSLRAAVDQLTRLVQGQQSQIVALAGTRSPAAPVQVAPPPPTVSAPAAPAPSPRASVPPPPPAAVATTPGREVSADEQIADLMKAKKADLANTAVSLGIPVDETMTKDDLAEAIVAKRRSGLKTTE